MASNVAELRRLVGSATVDRASACLRNGAVLSVEWQDGGGRLVGRVDGTAPAAYSTSATFDSSSTGVLHAFRGVCNCPVGLNCKHSVALLLAAFADKTQAAAPVVEPWERELGALADAPTAEPATHALALACALVDTPPGAPAWQRLPAVRLAMRPLISGRNGWVKTGAAWSSLDNLGYAHSVRADHLRVLQELRALAAAARSPGSYGYYQHPALIHLDELPGRAAWEVLAELRDLGLPLVAGREGWPVGLSRERASLTIDLRRDTDGLDVQPVITVDGRRVDRERVVLLGAPAYGLAWWPEGGQATGLRLASLARPADPVVERILALGGLSVPARDAGRFLSAYVPALRHRVPVDCADGSVSIAEVEPPRLALQVRHREGHVVTLTWDWLYRHGEDVRREPLRPPSPPTLGRDATAEAEVLAPVLDALRDRPELWARAQPWSPSQLLPTVDLAGMSAVRFCSDLLPALESLEGLAVAVAGEAATYREATVPPVVTVSGSGEGADRDWFDLAVSVRIDGEDVPFEPLFVALACGQSELILASGTWFSLDRPELAALGALIAEARSLQEPGARGLKVSRWQASLWEDLVALGVVDGQAAAWTDSVRALSGAKDLAPPPVPGTLHAELRPYQAAGFGWLTHLHAHGLGGILADEMGLGKTLQALALICHSVETRPAGAPFLVVAPTSVVANWAAECARFTPTLTVRAITETVARRGVALAEVAAGADIVLTSYTLLRLEEADYEALHWSGLILDEAQFVKNHQSRAYASARRIRAEVKVAITGTPMENNLMELWALLSITAPGLFPSPKQFTDTYRTPIEKGRDQVALERLRRRVAPLLLRRTKAEVAVDLPAKQEQILELELTPRHRKIYQTHLQRERQKVLGLLDDLDDNRFEIFRSLTLLRQAALDPALIDPAYAGAGSTKLDALMDLLGELVREGHRALVFSQFTRFLDAAGRRLDATGIDFCRLDGSTRNRGRVLEAWRDGTAPAFLISLKAGGFGLNLTEADYCILLDPWWNPATEAQAVDRAHRIGQTRNVMVYRLVAKDTIEDKVVALKARKAELIGSVLDGGDFASGSLTAADIRSLLT